MVTLNRLEARLVQLEYLLLEAADLTLLREHCELALVLLALECRIESRPGESTSGLSSLVASTTTPARGARLGLDAHRGLGRSADLRRFGLSFALHALRCGRNRLVRADLDDIVQVGGLVVLGLCVCVATLSFGSRGIEKSTPTCINEDLGLELIGTLNVRRKVGITCRRRQLCELPIC
ncbi:hypothetical protein PENSPDRAFT_657566 [Peniophora sp. CONT]|nr:hypothetical protein PENSPDRAFT_657566 [Peniophora sp. CONT]